MTTYRLPFTREEYLSRLEKTRRAMEAARLDLLLVSSPENILWLTGYQAKGIFAFQMLLVPASGAVRLVTRAIETGNVIAMPRESVVDEFVTYGDTEVPTAALVALVTSKYAGARRVGVEKVNMYFGVSRFEAIRDGLASVDLVDASHLVDRQRLLKSPAEIACFRRAAAISDAAYEEAKGAVKVGTTDSEVAAVIMASLIRHGSEYCAVWPNVMAGWRGGLAHAGWDNKRLEPGEPLCLEFAGSVERYHAPLYRTVIPGEPSAEIRRVADCAVRAHDAGLAAMGPGVAIDAVDRAVRSVIREAGCLNYAHSRFGYTLGMAFPPTWAQSLSVNIVPGSDVVFEPGMLFHLLVYLLEPARFGIGVSHSVLVTDTGVETLTKSSKAPVFV
ncbi:MAG: Xaa-Pro peptidase family protein [Alphaproteobacteria bacterium]